RASVVLRLADEVDASRGDLIAHPSAPPEVRTGLAATAVWLAERPLDPQRAYLLKHTTRTAPARIAARSRLDPETLSAVPAASLDLNDVGRIAERCARPPVCDPSRDTPATGAVLPTL